VSINLTWQSGIMPRKLPSSYVRKLNDQQKTQKAIEANRQKRHEQQQASNQTSGRVKGFTTICQACGTRSNFIVDNLGHATCNHCRAIAPYRISNVA
jgi:hypothetical protein